MLLIFDCDGVVIDSMLLHSEVEAEAYDRLGIKVSPHDLARRFAGMPQIEVSRILEKETGCKVPSDFDVEKIKEEVFNQRLKAIPHIHEALDRLGDISRCIASGSGLATVEHCLSLVGLHDHFAPHIYSSEMVAKGKPAPDLFLFAANQLGASPDDCLVVEDGIAGVQAAKAAGMNVVGFTGGCHCDEEHGARLHDEGAKHVFSDMHNLPDIVSQFQKTKIRRQK